MDKFGASCIITAAFLITPIVAVCLAIAESGPIDALVAIVTSKMQVRVTFTNIIFLIIVVCVCSYRSIFSPEVFVR